MIRILCALALTLPLAGQTNVDRGIAVGLDVSPGMVRDGDTLRVAFTIRDEATKTPLTGVRPAAWLAPHVSRSRDCAGSAARFLSGSIIDRAAVDFNNYYVLALNDDPSISVVDPRFSFGGSQLLALIGLESRGDDWALTPDGETLFVTMPDIGTVAVADTNHWKVRRNIAVGGRPSNVKLQQDKLAAWVTTGEEIVVLSPDRVDGRVAGRFAGSSVAFDDAHTAFVRRAESILPIDTRDLSPLAPIAAAKSMGSIVTYSPGARLLYLADPATGRVVALHRSGKEAARIEATPGFTQLRFAPGGRYAFLPNPAANIVEILDTASNRIVQTADIADGPDQVTFTDRLAFIRRRGSDAVMMIPLQRVGASDSIGIADFTGGQHPLGAGRFGASADSIVEAPDGPAVLVANPADRSIYYYKEGMAAPMGGFKNGSREPRAVLIVDRSLREQPGGVYATSAKVEDAGKYDVVFFLDSPRVVTCFPLDVAERPETCEKRTHRAVIEPLDEPVSVRAGGAARIRFRIADATTRQTRAAGEVEVVVMAAPGIWQRRTSAKPSDEGTYEVEVTPPAAGTYYVWIASAAAGLPINNPHFIRFEVN